MYETGDIAERVLLTGVFAKSPPCLNELGELVRTLGGVEVGRITQIMERPHPGHYFGKGKVDEICSAVRDLDADVVITDDELTPGQLKFLQKRLDVKLLDRTQVILDIFSQNAQTAEAKTQVQIARLRYRLSHLMGIGVWLSRQGGVARGMGVGNRGPGETKLEMDRRHIRHRISELSKELDAIKSRRGTSRALREKSIPSVALVGYTNAGKSTLLNALTGAGVLSEDKLFATLATTTRRCEGIHALLTDTVGFIMKLPHQLVGSFRATLEEVRHADVLVHVTDASHPMLDAQMAAVYETLKELGAAAIPTITAHNKIDITIEPPPPDFRAVRTLCISAKTGAGLNVLADAVNDAVHSLGK